MNKQEKLSRLFESDTYKNIGFLGVGIMLGMLIIVYTTTLTIPMTPRIIIIITTLAVLVMTVLQHKQFYKQLKELIW